MLNPVFYYSFFQGENDLSMISIILQSALVLMFLMAGIGKVTGSKMHVEGFIVGQYIQVQG